jgi:ferrochelatase
MRIGVVLLNFGEPERGTEAEVVPFLERIFTTNASLEGDGTEEQVRARAGELARRRAPALVAEYAEIGGSPLNAQAAAQAVAVEGELMRRGHDVTTYVAMQFTEPDITSAVARARSDGVERLVALPVYPLCGPSTTVAALASVSRAVGDAGWDVHVAEIAGWHPHPLYILLRAEGILLLAAENGLDLHADARLVFSAHGTPLKYLREGSRYDVYVRDCCARVAAAAGVSRYVIGYQNHTNRPVEWTQPDIADAVRGVDTRSVVVVPISFMHEQSETLAELDIELRAEAEAAGIGFHRVPVPHDDPRFTTVLADLVEGALRNDLHDCRCRAGAVCLGRSVP